MKKSRGVGKISEEKQSQRILPIIVKPGGKNRV
jgi:hypothetical protein